MDKKQTLLSDVHIREAVSWCSWTDRSTYFCLQCFDSVRLAQEDDPTCKKLSDGSAGMVNFLRT